MCLTRFRDVLEKIMEEKSLDLVGHQLVAMDLKRVREIERRISRVPVPPELRGGQLVHLWSLLAPRDVEARVAARRAREALSPRATRRLDKEVARLVKRMGMP